jgi:hypothetical protein
LPAEATLAKYGIPLDRAGLYEDDDLIPVCLGGDNASPLNHWPQPNSTTRGAADKDSSSGASAPRSVLPAMTRCWPGIRLPLRRTGSHYGRRSCVDGRQLSAGSLRLRLELRG